MKIGNREAGRTCVYRGVQPKRESVNRPLLMGKMTLGGIFSIRRWTFMHYHLQESCFGQLETCESSANNVTKISD